MPHQADAHPRDGAQTLVNQAKPASLTPDPICMRILIQSKIRGEVQKQARGAALQGQRQLHAQPVGDEVHVTPRYSGRRRMYSESQDIAGKEWPTRPNPCFHWDATQAMQPAPRREPQREEVQRHPGQHGGMSPIDGLTTRILETWPKGDVQRGGPSDPLLQLSPQSAESPYQRDGQSHHRRGPHPCARVKGDQPKPLGPSLQDPSVLDPIG